MTSDIGPSWFEALRDSVFSKDWFRQLDKFVSGERGWKKVHPGPGEVWSWTRAVDIRSVKVVILGTRTLLLRAAGRAAATEER